MTLKAASAKANMCSSTERKYYQQYLKDRNVDIPLSKYYKRYEQDQRNEFIGYIVNDKMSVKAARKKANINDCSAYNYYRQYLRDNNLPLHVPKVITQDQINALIGYIVDDKMSIYQASLKANITCKTGSKYYQQYLNNKEE